MTSDHCQYSPHPSVELLTQQIQSANTLTRSIIENLAPGKELVPQLATLNPPHWEFAHITWFHEFWIHRKGCHEHLSLYKDADVLFNSSTVAHADRWSIPLVSLESILRYNREVCNKTSELLSKPLSDEDAYFIQLVIHHYDMHNEAFAIMWQALEYPMPFEPYSVSTKTVCNKEFIEFSKTNMTLGSSTQQGFLFDNEKWQHPLTVEPFTISSSAVSNEQYREFVLAKGSQAMPNHWKYESGVWYERFFDQWRVMDDQQAVRHIPFEDAVEYTSQQHLRLPTEAELTLLMATNPNDWQASDLWEWTSSPFLPFEGFTPDPYVDYSQPWFDGTYQVLKGWSPFTVERMRRIGFRNFYQTKRNDIFSGFRVCLV